MADFLSLTAKLGLDGTGFQRGISQAGRQFDRFTSGIKGRIAAAFSIGAITAFGRSVVQAAGRFKDLSEQSGFSVETIQRLDYVARQSGLSFEDLQAGINAFLKSGNATEDMVKDLTLALSGVDIGESRLLALEKALGRSGLKMRAFFADLQAGKAAQAPVFDVEQIDQLAKKFDRYMLGAKAHTASLIEDFLYIVGLQKSVPTSAAGRSSAPQPAGIDVSKLKAEADALLAPEVEREDLKLTELILDHELKRLSVAEQQMFYEKEIQKIRESIAQNSETTNADKLRRIQDEIKYMELIQKRDNLNEKKAPGDLVGGDWLTRIGGFAGGRQTTESKLDTLNRTMQRILDVVDNRGIKFRDN